MDPSPLLSSSSSTTATTTFFFSSSFSDDLLFLVVARVPPPWYPLARLLLTCTALNGCVRRLVLAECTAMEMEPRVDDDDQESTGSLLNALRHVRHAKAFWSVEAWFTVKHGCGGGGNAWIVKLDRIKGTVKARNKSWVCGKWVPLKAGDNNNDNDKDERFVWCDGTMQLLLSSTGARYDVKEVMVDGDDDDNGACRIVELRRRPWPAVAAAGGGGGGEGKGLARFSGFAYIGAL